MKRKNSFKAMKTMEFSYDNMRSVYENVKYFKAITTLGRL